MTPQLRFPEFTILPETKRLGDVTKWASGGTPSKDNPLYWSGNIPWISAATMHGNTFSTSKRMLTDMGVKNGSKIAKKGSILLLVRGSMLFNTIPVGVAGVDVAFNQDVKSITGTEIEHTYLYHFLKKSEHALLSKVVGTGIGAGKLDTDELQSTKLYLPQTAEQQKIADFLTMVDDKITALDKKVELLKQYKKGVMQQIFSQQARFKDENGQDYLEWREKRLGDMLASATNGLSDNQNMQQNGYRVTRIETISENKINLNKVGYVHTDKNIQAYKLLKGDLLFSNINSPSQIGRIVYVDQDYDLYHGMNLLRLRTNNENSALYLYYLLASSRYKQYFERICNKAVNQASINQTDLKSTLIYTPTPQEQQKIATFLTTLDNKITAEQSRLDATKEWKKGLLQRMFI